MYAHTHTPCCPPSKQEVLVGLFMLILGLFMVLVGLIIVSHTHRVARHQSRKCQEQDLIRWRVRHKCQKRPILEVNETYYRSKRDLGSSKGQARRPRHAGPSQRWCRMRRRWPRPVYIIRLFHFYNRSLLCRIRRRWRHPIKIYVCVCAHACTHCHMCVCVCVCVCVCACMHTCIQHTRERERESIHTHIHTHTHITSLAARMSLRMSSLFTAPSTSLRASLITLPISLVISSANVSTPRSRSLATAASSSSCLPKISRSQCPSCTIQKLRYREHFWECVPLG